MADTTHDTLAGALAAVQAELPRVTKGETARVDMKGGGSYSYSYADLADISAVVLPLMGKHGLAFLCRPTVNDAGSFVLAYSLLHTSSERIDGEYPLSTQGGPQAVGSAITYARRYVLCAITGVAPEDDDGQAAQQEATRQRSRNDQPPAQPSAQPRINAAFRKLSAAKHDSYANLWERLSDIVGGNPSEVDWQAADQSRLEALATDAERIASQVDDA